jgi:serine protease AprX
MRHLGARSGGRSNALWGRGSRGESRSNALWGRGGRRAGVLVAAVSVFAMASVAGAGLKTNGDGSSGGDLKLKSYVPDTLLSSIQQDPKQTFDVIVQSNDRAEKSRGFIQKIVGDTSGSSDENVRSGNVKQVFLSISGGQMTLSGRQILFLAKKGLAASIMPNETVKLQALGTGAGLTNTQLWPWATGAPVDWIKSSPDAATIAVVDSGIDANRADFSGRVLASVNLASLSPNSPGDGYGHGTFVAGIAAGAAPGYAGAAPKADLVSIDVMNDQGQATVGDVVKAADWILANKQTYNIRVANFSLHAVNRASILFDPLDAAVERLWLNGVVVVAASGNYGTPGAPSGVGFAPGNDPFVITVGAADIGSSVKAGDDNVAPWSAYGYTGDGFFKPEIGAPGRYMVGPVPANSVLTKVKPANVTDPVNGYMQLSGTSFAAPIVAAAAAVMVAQHPTWTPDQIKGALMVTATPQTGVTGNALGVGDVNFANARHYAKTPPNPNAGLNQFVRTAGDGTRSFDGAAWQQAALANKAWNAVAWADVAWSDAAWSSVAWGDVAWADVAWASAAWGSVAWADVAWGDVAWSDVAWADNTSLEPSGTDAPDASAAEQSALLQELGLAGELCDPLASVCSVTGAVTGTTGGLLP